MIHTLLVRLQLTRLKYNEMESKFEYYCAKVKAEGSSVKSYPIKKCKKGSHVYTYHFQAGIITRVIRYSGEKKNYLGVELEINPMRIFNSRNIVDLSSEDSMVPTITAVNNLFKSMDVDIRLENTDVRRIDYAINLHFDTKEQVYMYMQLLKRFRMPRNFNLKGEYVKGPNRWMTYENSIYLINNSRVINIYCKGDQVKTLKKFNLLYNEYYEIAETTIRFEVQNNYDAVYNIKQKYGFESFSIENYMKDEISLNSLKGVCEYLFTCGDYYTKEYVDKFLIDKAKEGEIKVKTAAIMLRIIEEAQRKSISRVIDELVWEGEKQDKIFRVLKYFCFFNINPVTIPKAWGYNYIPGPMQYIMSGGTDAIAWSDKWNGKSAS